MDIDECGMSWCSMDIFLMHQTALIAFMGCFKEASFMKTTPARDCRNVKKGYKDVMVGGASG